MNQPTEGIAVGGKHDGRVFLLGPSVGFTFNSGEPSEDLYLRTTELDEQGRVIFGPAKDAK